MTASEFIESKTTNRIAVPGFVYNLKKLLQKQEDKEWVRNYRIWKVIIDDREYYAVWEKRATPLTDEELTEDYGK